MSGLVKYLLWLQRRPGRVSLCLPLDHFIDLIYISHFTCEWGRGFCMGLLASPTITEEQDWDLTCIQE